MANLDAAANVTTDNVKTTQDYGDPGDGTEQFFGWNRVADGGDVAQGDRSDAAVTDPTAAGTLVSLLKGLLTINNSPLPVGAAALSASSGNVANATAAATLAGAASKTTYITGFVVTGAGATAAANVVGTITNLPGGTASFIVTAPAGVTTAFAPIVVTFPRPIPASATNTAIVVSVPALGAGNTHIAVTAFGFRV